MPVVFHTWDRGHTGESDGHKTRGMGRLLNVGYRTLIVQHLQDESERGAWVKRRVQRGFACLTDALLLRPFFHT